MLLGITTWFTVEPEHQSRAVRIALVAPLNSPTSFTESENSAQPTPGPTPTRTPSINASLNATLADIDTKSMIPKLSLNAPILFSPFLGVATWLAFQDEDQSRVIKIALIAPLSAPPVSAESENSPQPTSVANSTPTLKVTSTVPPATSTPTPTPPPTATPTTSPSPTATVADIDTKLMIPKLSLNAPILFSPVKNGTWEVGHLDQAVGYLEGTAPFGSASNAVVAGHVTLAPGISGPFANLGQLTPGDLIVVVDNDKQFLYIVENLQTVDRSAVRVTYPSNGGQLTLITCANWDSDEGRYSDRTVVKGRLIQG
jgi:LPXTG-site transpeptidase (sortase) family protein